MFLLAEHLGKTVAEIEQVTLSEWQYWIAYLSLKNAKQLKNDKQRSKTNLPRGR